MSEINNDIFCETLGTINRFRRAKYHRPPIGRCVHRQSFILHEKLIHLENFDFEADNFEKILRRHSQLTYYDLGPTF